MITTGDRIRRCRLLAGKTQRELAAELGITAATLAGWELDRRHPKPQTLARIATALGVSVSELVPEGSLIGESVFTGLSEPAIAELNAIAQDHPEYSDFLSGMIEDREFKQLVQMLYIYRAYRDFSVPLEESPAKLLSESIQKQLDRILCKIK